MRKLYKIILSIIFTLFITSLFFNNMIFCNGNRQFSKANVSLVDMAYNGKSTYVAVGSKGEIEVSKDGIHLTRVTTTVVKQDLTKVKWTGRVFVILSKSGRVLISTNGYKWDEGTMIKACTNQLNNVIYANRQMVVVGNNGIIYTSKDEKNFRLEKSNTKQSLNDVIYTKSLFVAVGNKGTILTSKDGKKWNVAKSGVTQNLKDVSWNGKKYITTGGDAVLSSSDAKRWTIKHFGLKADLSCIAWNKEGFVIVGKYYPNQNVPQLITLTSSDGVEWIRNKSNDWTEDYQKTMTVYDLIWTGKDYILISYSKLNDKYPYSVESDSGCNIGFSEDGTSWRYIAPSHLPGDTYGNNQQGLEMMRKALWDGKNLVVVGDTIIKYTNPDFSFYNNPSEDNVLRYSIPYIRKGISATNTSPSITYNGKEYIEDDGKSIIYTEGNYTCYGEENELVSTDGKYWVYNVNGGNLGD